MRDRQYNGQAAGQRIASDETRFVVRGGIVRDTEIAAWLKQRIAQCRKDGTDLDVPEDVPIFELDIDSIEAVLMSADLEEVLGREISPDLLFTFPTISELSRHLADTST